MPSVNISEHTDRPDFNNFLKSKLGLKFRVFQEINYVDNKSNRHQADVMIFNSEKIEVDLNSGKVTWDSDDAIISIIETKIKKEENLEKHESQLFKYLKVFNCRAGFLTNYNKVSSYIMDPDYLNYKKEIYNNEDLEKVVHFITDAIERYSEINVQKSPKEIIRLLESTIEDLTNFTGNISGEKWESVLRFNDTSEIREKKKELSQKEIENRDKFLQRSAAYIGIAQILFYITFRQFRIDENINFDPKLAPLSTAQGIPTQVQEIFEEVPNNNLNFKAIFGRNKVLAYLDDDAAPILRSIIKMLEGISAKFVIANDLVGQIFQRLMPYETRKIFAAFYTLNYAAELITKLAIKNQDDTVYDPACGSGTLLVNAYRRKKELGATQHKTILDEIRGSDISDIATMMSTVNLAIQDPSKWTNHVNIFPFDAIDFAWGMTRFQYHLTETPNGRIEIDPNIAYERYAPVDIIIANPPFTRGARLTQTQRNKLRNLYYVKKYKFRPNFKSISFYAFFLLIAPMLIKKEKGKIAFILPRGAINNKIMVDVWKILFKENFGLKIIVEASDIDESFSDSADQEIIVILEKNYEEKVRFVKLFGELSQKNISNLINKIESTNIPYKRDDDMLIQILSQREIQNKSCMEWKLYPSNMMTLLYQNFVPFNKNMISEYEQDKYDGDLSRHIEIVTENASRPVDYWFIPNKYWNLIDINKNTFIIRATSDNTVIKNNRVLEMTLPRKAIIPAVSRSLRNYSNFPPIIPESKIDHYFLVDEKMDGMERYYTWGKKAHEEGLFGSSHSTYTVNENHIGLLTKIDFYGGKTLVLRFSKPLMGSRMIILGFKTNSATLSDLLFSYLSSSFFLLDSLEKSRIRRAEFARINQIDIYTKFRFPNFLKIIKDEKLTNAIISLSEKHNGVEIIQNRKTIPILIRDARINTTSTLRALDQKWLKYFDLPEQYLDMVYQEIEERLSDISHARQKRRRTLNR